MPATLLVPGIQMAQFDSQHGSLDFIQPTIPADFFAAILFAAPVITQRADAMRDLLGVGYYHAAVSPGSQILAGIKANAAGIRERPCALATVRCPNGLRVVFDNVQGVTASEAENSLHIGCLPVEMDRNDGARAFRYSSRRIVGV